MAVGLWNENDRIEEINQILQMEIILASSAVFWGPEDIFVFSGSLS